MRWMWIDRIVELEKGRRCVAIKNVSLAEDVLHDHFPASVDSAGQRRPPLPVMPHSLVIEGMAQTAGILTGQARDFSEKVILAKIGKAVFHRLVPPGYTLRFTATLERIDAAGASTSGTVDLIDPVTSQALPLAEIDLLFSHVDQNRSGLDFPEHNFVFSGQFMDLLGRSAPSGAAPHAQ